MSAPRASSALSRFTVLDLTRVRAGPFPTRAAAEEAAVRLKGLGFDPGAVSLKQ